MSSVFLSDYIRQLEDVPSRNRCSSLEMSGFVPVSRIALLDRMPLASISSFTMSLWIRRVLSLSWM